MHEAFPLHPIQDHPQIVFERYYSSSALTDPGVAHPARGDRAAHTHLLPPPDAHRGEMSAPDLKSSHNSQEVCKKQTPSTESLPLYSSLPFRVDRACTMCE